eukprot:1341060-Amorphochlora_amoeboformis.AAC.1
MTARAARLTLATLALTTRVEGTPHVVGKTGRCSFWIGRSQGNEWRRRTSFNAHVYDSFVKVHRFCVCYYDMKPMYTPETLNVRQNTTLNLTVTLKTNPNT